MKTNPLTIVCKRILALTLGMLLMVSMLPLGNGRLFAEEEKSEGQKQFENIMTFNEPKTFNEEDVEPYGYGVGVPFILNKQDELLFYMTNASSSGSISTYYDKMKAGNTGDVLSGNTAASVMPAPPENLKRSYFVQAVAFDPTGSGRKDHIAFFGILWTGANVSPYFWVYDARNRVWSGDFRIPAGDFYVGCNWMKDKDLTDYEAANFVSITAGDYNGDGKDSVIVYAAANVDQYDRYNGSQMFRIEAASTSSISLAEAGIGLRHSYYADRYCGDEVAIEKMGCDLATGDVNGDGIDDLVAVTYMGGRYENKNQASATYCPEIRISYGSAEKSNMLQSADLTATLRQYLGKNDDGDFKYSTMVAPGVSVGNVDGKGADEVVIAGMKNSITGSGGKDNLRSDFNVSSDTMGIYVVGSDGIRLYKEQTVNAWTKSGFYPSDDVWSPLAVECVAMNGVGNAEKVFINGTLYSITGLGTDSASVSAAVTPDYFQSDHDNLDKSSTNMYIQSTAAGVFDGNEKGFEQIAYTVSCKTSGSKNYDYLMGLLGGKNYDSQGNNKNYYYTARNKMNDDTAYPGRVSGSNVSGNVSDWKGLNCIAVAVDNDCDGQLVRFKEKSFTYSDPEVVCVLQAAPYFSELYDYLADTSATTYTITNSYSFAQSESTSVSFGVAAVMGVETPACEFEIQAGYGLGWSQEFTKEIKTEEEFGWSAKDDDIVVICRTPVISYTYQMQDPTGSWTNDEVVISVPRQPVYKDISIEHYNEFAKYYNALIESYGSGYHTLDLIENEWLCHEGDPLSYISSSNSLFGTDGYEIIQKTPSSLGHASSSTSWSLTVGQSSSVTESMEHGFTFDSTFTMGPDIGVASVSAGVSLSLENMYGTSTSKTTAKETGISCEVHGIQKGMGDDYDFDYQMATWPSGVRRYSKGKAENVPVYGYALSNVKKPATDIKNAKITVNDQTYTGSALKPSPSSVTVNGNTLTKGTDYKIASYSNNTDAGTASITITGIGNYTGQATGTFKIKKASQKVTATVANTTMAVGDTQKLTVTGIGTLSYQSSDNDIATVASDGTITAKAVGSVDISATAAGDKNHNAGTGKVTIKIKKADPAKISVAEADITVADQTYTGKALTPKPTVIVNGTALNKGTDYTVTYTNNINAGTATLTVTGIGNYTGMKTANFRIAAKSIKNAKISDVKAKTYTGKALTQAITVTDGEEELEAGTDYTVTYADNINAGTATLTVKGKGNYKGSLTADFTIKAKAISGVTVSGIKAKTYTGKALKQSITVKDGMAQLTSGTDYTVSYSNNKNAGKATLTLTGKGNYTGSVKKTFTIKKAKQPMTVKAKTASVKAGKVKKAKQTLALSKTMTIKKAQGKKTFAKVKKGSSKYLTIDKTTGKISVKKGTKKGTYKIKVKVTAAGSKNYLKGSKTVTVTVKVK